MGPLTMDLTRHYGGDVLGARLPADTDARIKAATDMVDRAVSRWALAGCHASLSAAVSMMLDDQTDVEPLDMCIQLSATLLTVTVGTHMVPLALTPLGCLEYAA